MRALIVAVCTSLLSGAALADGASVHAAGSLKAVFTQLGKLYAEQGGAAPRFEFGPSGVLRDKIAGGAKADLFASANMSHPQTFVDAGKAAKVERFARNELCLLVRPGLAVTPGNALDHMLRRDLKLGMSTPKADPSGDYAVQMFERADALRPGAGSALLARVQQAELVGVGLLAGVLASAVAMGIGWAMARHAFDFHWTASPWVPLLGGVAGAGLALAAGWWGLREVLQRPVVQTLRRVAE